MVKSGGTGWKSVLDDALFIFKLGGIVVIIFDDK
jgi:hypothetical protein